MLKYNSPVQGDIIYYNCNLINNKTIDQGRGTDPNANFYESRDGYIIDDISKYYFSIVRFDINGSNKELPILIPLIEVGQTDINKTIYKISMMLDVDYLISGNQHQIQLKTTQTLEYQPQTTENIQVQQPLISQDLSNPYYFIYQYSHFVKLVNNTFEACITDLNNQFKVWYSNISGGASPDLQTKAPYIKYNPETEKFELYTHTYSSSSSKTAPSTASESLRLFFNSNLWGLIGNFPNVYNNGDLSTTNTTGFSYFTYEILINYDGSNIFKSLTNQGNLSGVNYFITYQDYKSTTTLWNPVQSIVFSSTLIPVVSEETGEPLQILENNVMTSKGSASSFQPIITDISLDTSEAHAYRNFISYVPTGEYRLTEMRGSGGLRDIDIQVFYRNRFNNELIPLKMFNGSSISVKIMFRKKDFNR